MEKAVAAELEKFDGVAAAVSSSALRSASLPDTALMRSILRNFHPKRSGDIYVVFEPNVFINDFDGLTGGLDPRLTLALRYLCAGNIRGRWPEVQNDQPPGHTVRHRTDAVGLFWCEATFGRNRESAVGSSRSLRGTSMTCSPITVVRR